VLGGSVIIACGHVLLGFNTLPQCSSWAAGDRARHRAACRTSARSSRSYPGAARRDAGFSIFTRLNLGAFTGPCSPAGWRNTAQRRFGCAAIGMFLSAVAWFRRRSARPATARGARRCRRAASARLALARRHPSASLLCAGVERFTLPWHQSAARHDLRIVVWCCAGCCSAPGCRAREETHRRADHVVRLLRGVLPGFEQQVVVQSVRRTPDRPHINGFGQPVPVVNAIYTLLATPFAALDLARRGGDPRRR
jgi:hypothetical protein